MGTIKKGEAAPAFELPGIEGNRYSLEEALARGPLLAAFFKVSCPTCQYTFPFIERLYQQFRPKGIQVWAVSQDDARASRQFAKEFGTTFPVLIDEYPYQASRKYGIKYVPTLFLIPRHGKVELVSDGFAKADLIEIQQWFAKSLSSQPPALFLPNERVPEFKPG
ncbi:MAG: peroxiredoxin family protein [Terriglobia bacterium]